MKDINMEHVETSTNIHFHDVDYVITVSTQQQQLHIQLENECTNNALPTQCWIGQFSSTYIQDMTRKTGNFKRFPVFVNMLLSAIERRSEAVYIDLLTRSDLEEYRQRKLCNRASPALLAVAEANFSDSPRACDSKQYLILTYVVAFDRVHYPLPLALVASPKLETLERIIRRLRRELQLSRENKDTIAIEKLNGIVGRLTQENQTLKNTLEEKNEMLQEKDTEIERLRASENECRTMYDELESRSMREIRAIQEEIRHWRSRKSESESENSYRIRCQQTQELLDSKTLELEMFKRESVSAQNQIQILEEKNRQLNRQISHSTKPNYNNNASRPWPRPRVSNYLQERMYAKDSDDSDQSESQAPKTKRFPRFDPTAYHQERQRRMQARSSTLRRKIHSACSGSECSNSSCDSRSSRRSISSQQRESVNRLAAPKNQTVLPPRARSVERTRSPSISSAPAKSSFKAEKTSIPSIRARPRSPRPAPSLTSPRNNTVKVSSSTESTVSTSSKKTPLPKLDCSMDSFSDIDDRLNALQQFLREAKKRSTRYPTAA